MNRSYVRGVLAILLVIVMVFAFTACDKKDAEMEKKPAKTQEKKEATEEKKE